MPRPSLLARLGLDRPELRAWAMFDWATSAVQTTVMVAVFPIYFVKVAGAGLPEGGATQRLATANSIALGAILLQRFEWIIYVFGGILVITGVRMMLQKDARIEPDKNPVVRLARRVLPFSDCYDGAHFLTRTVRGKVLATPLLLVLLVIEWSDLVFAIDSIPAIFSVTRDPFLVYSSNVFAILGLRALFFVLAGMMDRFVYLKPGVALILIFVGAKMTLSHWLHLPITVSLAVIVLILSASVVLSLRRTAEHEEMPA